MQIDFFSKDLPGDRPNGVSVQVDRLARELAVRGHLVTVHSFGKPPDDAPYAHHELSWLSTNRFFRKFEPALRFRQYAAASSAAVLHFHGDDWLARGSSHRVRTFYGSALQEALHARTVRRRAYQGLFWLFELVSTVRRGRKAGISESTRRSIPGIASVIHCGVPCNRYAPGGTRSSHPSILFVGDLDSRKRGRFLVDIFEKNVRGQVALCELVVVGPQPCSGEGVTYAGRLSENALIEAYRRAWVVCIPSSYEGFGVPAVEAMACGTPVVATPSVGIREIVSHDRTGILAADAALGDALVRVLTNEPLRNRLSLAGRDEAVRCFDTAIAAAAYEEIYRSVFKEVR